jgi:hypothetical protein
MGREVTLQLDVRLTGSYKNELTDLQTPYVALDAGTTKIAITDGTGDNQGDRLWSSKSRDLAIGVSETIDVFDFAGVDLGAGAGRDQLGQTMALAEMIEVMVKVRRGSAGVLEIDTSLANGWTTLLDGVVRLKATSTQDAVFVILVPADGVGTITDGSNHLLKFTAVGGAVEYDVHLAGRSA